MTKRKDDGPRKPTTARSALPPGERADEEKVTDRLSEAWNAFANGRASREDAEIILTDLANESEFYFVAAPGTPNEVLTFREGKRALYGRILFLLDRPTSYTEGLRRAALDELQFTEVEQHG